MCMRMEHVYYTYPCANVLPLTAAIGESMNDIVKCTTLFYPNGTLSLILIQVQVVCYILSK